MLEGGNEQLTSFFDGRGIHDALGLNRYETEEASFYRGRLSGYVGRLSRGGTYEGREACRGGKKYRTEDGDRTDVAVRGG